MSRATIADSQGPSWTEVTLGALLSVALGVVGAAAFLVLKPVITTKELPKEPVAGAIYYLAGSTEGSKAKQAMSKQNLFAQGHSVALTEDEINALIAPAAAAPAKGKPAAAPAAAAPPTSTLTTGAPNVRIRMGELQLAVPLHINALGLDASVVMQAKGGISRQGEAFVFVPSEVYLGSLPVNRIPAAEGYVMKLMLASKTMPEGVVAAWSKLSDVKLDGSTLHLTIP